MPSPTDWNSDDLTDKQIDDAAGYVMEVLRPDVPRSSYSNARRGLEVFDAIIREFEAAGITHIPVAKLKEAVANIRAASD